VSQDEQRVFLPEPPPADLPDRIATALASIPDGVDPDLVRQVRTLCSPPYERSRVVINALIRLSHRGADQKAWERGLVDACRILDAAHQMEQILTQWFEGRHAFEEQRVRERLQVPACGHQEPEIGCVSCAVALMRAAAEELARETYRVAGDLEGRGKARRSRPGRKGKDNQMNATVEGAARIIGKLLASDDVMREAGNKKRGGGEKFAEALNEALEEIEPELEKHGISSASVEGVAWQPKKPPQVKSAKMLGRVVFENHLGLEQSVSANEVWGELKKAAKQKK
jgi:hypothetical protein